MKRSLCGILLALLMVAGSGCSLFKEKVTPKPTPPAGTGLIKVVDVSNDTHEIFDVDVIGLLWNGLEEALYYRGFLYAGSRETAPITMEAHVVKYDKGSFWLRPVMPWWGKTLLTVRVDVKQGGALIQTIESTQTISVGNGATAWNGWRKVFADVSEDVVKQLTVRGQVPAVPAAPAG
jgi:hypothetical protein